MSKTRENRLWAWLAKARIYYKHSLHMDRVENSLRKGMADVNGCLDGTDFWIELKTAARPKDPLSIIQTKWQPQQTPWVRSRSRAGGKVFVLIQVGQGHEARRYLLEGSNAPYIKEGRTEAWLANRSLVYGTCTAQEVIKIATFSF